MTKRLDTSDIANELRGASAFFPKNRTQAPPSEPTRISNQRTKEEPVAGTRDTVVSRHHDTKTPQTSTTPPPPSAASPLPYAQQTIEKLRTAVKQLGKEAATHRFTVEEKRALKTIAYEYANKDIVTSENEITRIAVNFLLDDYRMNKDKSLLARVLDSLNK